LVESRRRGRGYEENNLAGSRLKWIKKIKGRSATANVEERR
jgi:hypothetical protein